MVNPCQALPHEVWVNILNQVEDNKQLATCRLVCKQWDPIAEKAMFSKELEIYDTDTFVAKLHYHLTKKPALALLIKNVYFMSHYEKPNPLYNELLKLVMTASMESVQGWFPPEGSEQLFYQIILDSPHKFNKIKRIPLALMNDSNTKCLFALKESLEYMFLSVPDLESDKILDNLHLFTKLDVLVFKNYNIRDIMELDLILGRLQCVTEMRLYMHFSEENYISKSSEEMNAWLVQNVKIDEKMKSISEASSRNQKHWCNFAEYLAYKYPNLHLCRITGMALNGDIERILQATKHIPFFILKENKCDSPEHLWTVGYMMKSPSNTVRIEYSPLFDAEDNVCKIQEVCRKGDTATTNFSIKLRHDSTHAYIKQLLSSVGSGTSVITKATIDLVHWKDQDNLQDLLNFYDILNLMPAVQHLEFADATIEYQELDSGGLTLNDLKTLEIIGAKIDYKVISQLGSIAPNLEHLAISSSVVVGREEKLAIIMPHSNLSSLTFQTKKFNWTMNDSDRKRRPELQELASNEDKMNIKEIMHLSIKMEHFSWRYYLLKPNSQVVTMLSDDEFKRHAIASRIVSIECKSLSSLSFAVNDLNIAMHFENGELKSPFEISHYLEMEKELHDLKRM